MTTSRLHLVAPTLLAALLLGACASKPSTPIAASTTAPAPVADRSAAAGNSAGASAQAAPQSQVAAVDLTRNAAAGQPQSQLSPYVYFDFDSALIRQEFKPSIEAHARQLIAAPGERLRVAGHTDERGGREYNLALGQKRAEAVSRALALMGADATRIEAVSYGEERPKAQGADETAWSKNRRAELRTASR